MLLMKSLTRESISYVFGSGIFGLLNHLPVITVTDASDDHIHPTFVDNLK